MFQKSLHLLLGAAVVLLLAIVVISFLDDSGPDDYLSDAERLIASGEYARAIAALDRVEGGPRVQGVPARRERLLRLRYDANTRLGDAAGALDDVELLLRDAPDDEALLLDRIRLLALDNQGAAARNAAMQFLAKHPHHGRALELAGEACQREYQPALAALLERLARDLPADDQDAARAHVWSYVFRPAGDPEIATAEAALATSYSRDSRLVTLWLSVREALAALRTDAQTALGYFQKSLEGTGTPVAAFRAFALSLDQSRRIDDLLVASEIYRRRFDHRYVDEAGATAAWALLRDGQYAAAAATYLRWLSPTTLAARITAAEIDRGAIDLLVARAWAAHNMGDLQLARACWRDVDLVRKVADNEAVSITASVLQLLEKSDERAESSLGSTLRRMSYSDVPVDRVDLLPAFANLLLDVLRRRGTGADAEQGVLRTWRQARPRAIEPLLALADHLATRGQHLGALQTLEDARNLAPADPRIFPAVLAVMRVHAPSFGHDGETLLAQCLRLKKALPEVRHPLGFLFCGEQALAQRNLPVALACARAAVDAFPQARACRLLLVRTLLAAGQAAEATTLAATTVRELPPDAETLDVALQAHAAAKVDHRHLLHAAITSDLRSGPVVGELLRAELARSPTTAHAFVPRDAERTAALRPLAAHARAAAGDAIGAAALLADRAGFADLPPPARADLVRAVAATARAAATNTADAALEPVVRQWLKDLEPIAPAGVPALLDAARALAASHPRSASMLASTAIAAATPEQRDGSGLLLTGDLALRVGNWQQAVSAWTGALAFEDGIAGAERLVRLCYALGRSDRAAAVADLVPAFTDPALASRCGRADAARDLVLASVQADPYELGLACQLALFGQAALVDWAAVEGDELGKRLELLACLREPALAPFAKARVEALIAQEGRGKANRLLLARTLRDLGDGAAAAELHQGLDADGLADVVVWREVALAVGTPGYTVSKPLADKIQGALATGALQPSPTTLAFAMRLAEDAMRAAPASGNADDLRLTTWLQAPQHAPLGGADLELVVTRLRPLQAWQVIVAALAAPFPIDRELLLDRLLAVADTIVRTDPSATDRIYAGALRYLANDGPRGAIVHFLLDHADRARTQAPAASKRVQLLHDHLAAVAAGKQGDRWLGATVRRLVAAEGAAKTVARIDEHLRGQPTAISLWVERTRLLATSPDGPAAIAALRSVLQHGGSPGAMLAMLTMAAEARVGRPTDVAALAALPAALRDSPEGRYCSAWIALRSGAADEARQHFAASPKRDDGMHLFGRGLAALQGTGKVAIAEARDAFAQLQRDYPSSSAARNAGSFAAQLADR